MINWPRTVRLHASPGAARAYRSPSPLDRTADSDARYALVEPCLLLSIVVPVYNEEDRIVACVHAIRAFFERNRISGEILVVDDGSDDRTAMISARLASEYANVRALEEPHRGKARAVISGLYASSGTFVGFSDVDLATPLETWLECHRALLSGAGVTIASREGQGASRIGEPWYRHAMGRVFNGLTRSLLLPGIHDTQCGFKFFTKDAIEKILPRCQLYAEASVVSRARVTAFDVELLYIARKLGMRIAVIPVTWTYGAQSKINPVTDTFQNLRDVIVVRWNGWRGRYG